METIEKPWNTKKSYSREIHHRETYSKMDPIKFLISEGGVKQEDGSWIMTNDLILRKKSPIVKNGRFIVKISRIERNFNCGGQSLTSLEGGPEYVGGNFWCNGNPKLRKLKHGPKYVGGLYDCSYCNIKSLISLKGVYFRDLDISENKITSMKSFPDNIKGSLNASNNLLETLEGMPQTGGEANFLNNPLKTLYGFKVPTGNDIVRFSDHIIGNNLTFSEIDFVMHQQYDREKMYKNYHNQLLKRIINKNTPDDLKRIIWPEKMIKSGKIDNALKSLKTINKFNL